MQDAALLLFLIVKGKRRKKDPKSWEPIGQVWSGDFIFCSQNHAKDTWIFWFLSTFPSSLFLFRLSFQYHSAWKGWLEVSLRPQAETILKKYSFVNNFPANRSAELKHLKKDLNYNSLIKRLKQKSYPCLKKAAAAIQNKNLLTILTTLCVTFNTMKPATSKRPYPRTCNSLYVINCKKQSKTAVCNTEPSNQRPVH